MERINSTTDKLTSKIEIFGTLGPSCHTEDLLARMIECGMNGIRLNLSHGSLVKQKKWIDNLHNALNRTKEDFLFLIDLKGRELRMQNTETMKLSLDQPVEFGRDVPICPEILNMAMPQDSILIDDGKVHLEVIAKQNGSLTCRVLAGECIEP